LRLRFGVLAAILLAPLGFVPAAEAGSSGSEPSPWTWADRGPKFLDVSCAAPGRCVAVGEGQNLLRSTPGEDGGLAWSKVGLDDARSLVAVTCNGERCIAVSGGDGTTDGVSKVFRSADAGATWSDADPLPPASIAPKLDTQVAADVACDPAGDCVIAGPDGGIWRSSNRGESWNALRDTSLGLPYTKLACPAADLCVLVGSKADKSAASAILRVRDATKLPAPTTGDLTAVACESATFCTAADSLGRVLSTSSPFRDWDPPVLLPKATNLVALDCPAAETCVGIAGKGGAMRATSRSGGKWVASDWVKRPTATVKLGAVDCAETNCVAVGKTAAWYGSADTGFGWEQVNEVDKFDGVDCRAVDGSGICVAGGMDDIGRSTTAGDLWTTPLSGVTGLGIKGVSCAGLPECLALGKDRVLGTPDAGITWESRIAAGTVTAGPEAFSCFDADECVGVGGGAIFTTFDAATSGWFVGSIPTAPGEALKGVACPAPTLCVVASAAGIYRGELSVGGDAVRWRWTASDADPDDPLAAVACASTTSCTVVGDKGQVFTSADASLLTWNFRRIGTGPTATRPPLGAVSCPAEGVCVAGGFGGYFASTTSNWENWSLDQVDGSPRPKLAAFACQSPTRCVAVGDTVLTFDRAG
jgi:hypothetical protein